MPFNLAWISKLNGFLVLLQVGTKGVAGFKAPPLIRDNIHRQNDLPAVYSTTVQ